MNHDRLPEDPAKQWEVLLCIIAFEEKKIDRKPEGAIETLTYIFNHKGIRTIFTEWLRQMTLRYDKQLADDDASRKNDEISVLWRQRGNVKFKAELFEESYELFTKSVLYANKGGPTYAMALANRSAASLRLKRYKESLRDVQRALNHKYPPDLQHKLFLRRADCFYEMGQRQNCIEAMRLAVKHNERVQLRGISKVEFERSYGLLSEKLRNIAEDVPQSGHKLPTLFMGENPDFMNASKAVQLVRNEKYGRHVVVNEPVNRGDVIFAEEPFASVKLTDKDLPHPFFCDSCCTADQALIGCDDCSRVMYCDEACFYLGKSYYHKWECAGVRANIFPLIGIAHLAFRVMLTYAHKGFPRLAENVPPPTTAAGLIEAYSLVDNVDIYKTQYESFYSMFNLECNFDSSVNTDKIQYALSSTMLTLYLDKYTKFFEYFPARVGYPLPMSEMKLLCAGLIFRGLGQLVTNAHTVMELNTGPPIREKPNCFLVTQMTNPWRSVGTGVYPTASMMNHSCEPNVTNLFYKNYLIVKVIREVPKGEEILNCYGPHYARQSTEERRETLLTQYGFHCECPACEDQGRKDFVSLFSAYACWSCRGPVTWEGTRMGCHACSKDFPLQKAQNAAETADALHAIAMRGSSSKEDRLEAMVRSYRLMQQVSYRHHNLLRSASDDLAMLYAAVGDYTKSMELIKQNIQSFEFQYGSFSVEVTNEIRKMSNLMLGRIMKYLDNPEQDERQPMPIRDWIRETLKIARKANQLMELNFGTWQPMYKVLKNNERVLEGMLVGPHFHDPAECHSQMHRISLI